MRAKSPKDQRRLYGDLAWTWPIISPLEHSFEEAGEFWWTMRTFSRIEVNTLLDLGCGGGHNDYTLKKYFQVTGIDISESMLALARRLNPEVTYCPGDMRSVRLEEQFDAVLIADSIAYMLSVEDLQAAFMTAFVHLKPGGVFCTYAEVTKERFQQNHTRSSTYTGDGATITLVENSFDPNPADTTYENTFIYLIRRGGRLSIETDRHLGGIFPEQTWTGLLKAVGFEVAQTTFSGGDYPVFVGIKPEIKPVTVIP